MTSDKNHQISDTEAAEILWAFGPKSRYAHAYPGRKALAAGVPLCGIQCATNQITEEFDLTDDRVREAACPNCLARLVFAKYMKPAGRHHAAQYGGPLQ